MQDALKQLTWVFWVTGGLTACVGLDLAVRGAHRVPTGRTWSMPGGDAARGSVAARQYGCGACHVIGGVRGATGRVGPPLSDFRERMFVAGELPNTPENLIAWIRHPRSISARTAMPDLGVSDQEARDLVALLYDLP